MTDAPDGTLPPRRSLGKRTRAAAPQWRGKKRPPGAPSGRQYAALHAIRQHLLEHGRPPSHRELAERLGRAKGSAQYMTRRLGADGFLDLTRDPYTLTPKALRALHGDGGHADHVAADLAFTRAIETALEARDRLYQLASFGGLEPSEIVRFAQLERALRELDPGARALDLPDETAAALAALEAIERRTESDR